MWRCIISSNNAPHIIIISTLVFIALNIFENVIHFSIGRNIEGEHSITNIHLVKPSIVDTIKIVLVMVIFAVLQGIFTYFFVRLVR